MNYDEMSNLEINRKVAVALGHKLNKDVSHEQDVGCFEGCEQEFHALVGESGNGDSFDYCNNPSDAWPIIVDNGISIQPTGNSWISGSSILGSQFIDKKPLRAAMICFLKMKDLSHE